MGWFDFLWKKDEPAKKQKPPQPFHQPERTKSSPVQAERIRRYVSPQPAQTSNLSKEDALKVTDTSRLERFLKLEQPPHNSVLELYCPVRKARIYCHSIVVDKLGDLTRFIISSLHDGHSIEEVCRLTQMGDITIKEETDYLVRGGLIGESRDALTELGYQYGELLKVFNTLSDGIDVAFNEFANLFEDIEEDYITTPDEGFILDKKYISELTRNENYANSKTIALEHIEADTPFCEEIRNSFYTTVKIEKEHIGYKAVHIKDFSKGTIYVKEPCVGIVIPCDCVSLRPRYEWLNPYRGILSAICQVDEAFSNQLLTDMARLLVIASKEEEAADEIRVDINTITGSIQRVSDKLTESPDNNVRLVMERNTLQTVLDVDKCEGIYLEEVDRKMMYETRYFTYDQMEAQ